MTSAHGGRNGSAEQESRVKLHRCSQTRLFRTVEINSLDVGSLGGIQSRCHSTHHVSKVAARLLPDAIHSGVEHSLSVPIERSSRRRDGVPPIFWEVIKVCGDALVPKANGVIEQGTVIVEN